MQVGIGLHFSEEVEPGAKNEKLGNKKQSLALGYGLFHETIGIISAKRFIPAQNRPRRIPGNAQGKAKGSSQGFLIGKVGGNALGCQHHAAKC